MRRNCKCRLWVKSRSLVNQFWKTWAWYFELEKFLPKGELKRWKICTLCRKSQCNRNWKFWELKDLQLLIKIQNYQHDAQGLKCQGGRALRRNCKQPFNLFIDIRKEWHLYAYMQLCVSKDLLRQKYLYLRLRGMRRWHFCWLYVKCCECGKSVQIHFF